MPPNPIRIPISEPPSKVIALGRIIEMKLRFIDGRSRSLCPKNLYVCTGKSGHGLWFLPWKGKRAKAIVGEDMGKVFQRFHGSSAMPSDGVGLYVPDLPSELEGVARVESFVYKAETKGSSRTGTLYEHEVGDTGERKVGTKIWLCEGKNGDQHFATLGSKSFPVTTERGIVG